MYDFSCLLQKNKMLANFLISANFVVHFRCVKLTENNAYCLFGLYNTLTVVVNMMRKHVQKKKP